MNTQRQIYKALSEIVGEHNLLINEPMKEHITFKIGGPADYYVRPKDIDSLKELLRYIKKENLPYYIIGNGSNLLVKDKGFRGIVIDLLDLNNINVKGNTIVAQTGALLSEIADIAKDNSLTGYEFASGIPGTIGGAVRMNAGAYGGEHKDVVKSIEILDENENLKTLSKEECKFSYRHSVIQDKPYIVVSVELDLSEGDKKVIQETMDDLNQRRREKQPLEFPSAGSTFKRPTGYYAGTLIDESGLKGKTIGGAQVSTKHAGFIINYDNASAKDVLDLIKTVQEVIKDLHGVIIEPEVIVIGEDYDEND